MKHKRTKKHSSSSTHQQALGSKLKVISYLLDQLSGQYWTLNSSPDNIKVEVGVLSGVNNTGEEVE